MAGSNVVTPEARVSYPNVFRPGKPMNPANEPKYSLVLLFPKGQDLAALKAAVMAVMTEKFGPKEGGAWPKTWRNPFRDQGEKESQGYEDGAVFITASTKTRPGLVGPDMNPIIDESEFYAGCYCRAQVRPYWYDNSGNKGIAFGLQNIMKTRDGEPLDGRMKAAEVFKEFANAEGDDDGDPFAM